MNKKKLPFVFVVVAVLLFFFTYQKCMPLIFYTLFAGVLAVYFWPVKMILELVKDKKRGFKNIAVSIVSNWLYNAVLCLSALWLYYPDSLQMPFAIAGLANAVTGLVYYFFSIDDERAIYHFILNIPCAALC
ncbi:MAG: hypothetical protein LBD87_03655 [Prevotellaceae bacterium]|nr:hypothetical protein [Prevotellaceae bacterium]